MWAFQIAASFLQPNRGVEGTRARESRHRRPLSQNITFIKAGEKPPSQRAFRFFAITRLQERKATRNISLAAEKALRWLWIKREDPWCSVLLGHELETDQPWLDCPGEADNLRPETPHDPGLGLGLGLGTPCVQAAPGRWFFTTFSNESFFWLHINSKQRNPNVNNEFMDLWMCKLYQRNFCSNVIFSTKDV